MLGLLCLAIQQYHSTIMLSPKPNSNNKEIKRKKNGTQRRDIGKQAVMKLCHLWISKVTISFLTVFTNIILYQ